MKLKTMTKKEVIAAAIRELERQCKSNGLAGLSKALLRKRYI